MTQPHWITNPPPLPARPDDSHKGTFGTVVVVGGCSTMMGAPALAAAAALRAGAGLVRIAAPKDVLPVAITIEPGATGLVLSGDAASDTRKLDRFDPDHRAVLAVGPGLGNSASARALVHVLWAGDRALVLDADGLNLLATGFSALPPEIPPDILLEIPPTPTANSPRPRVMTPHPGEFSRLAKVFGISHSPTDPATRPHAAIQLARACHAVVVLKGRQTIVTDAHRVYRNRTGNPALATAGTGDVLTGVISAFIAQGLDPFDAAVLGVHIHGLAADLWAADFGPTGLTAADLARLIPRAMHSYRSDSQATPGDRVPDS